MDSRKKKQPSEYPLFAVRLSEEQKEELTELIEQTRSALNKKVDEKTDRMWMKNEVVFEALILGLPLLKKQSNSRNKG